MDKSAVLAASFLLTACTAVAGNPVASPLPVVTVVKDKFPPRPLTLLYTTFQDHAVLQRDKPLPLWGLTAPGATVAVSLAGKNATATADAKGHWQLTFPALTTGGPYALVAKSSTGESQTLSDVMLGDVYLCSGQSNMELPLRLATNYDSELRAAQNTQLRLFHVQRYSSAVPRETFGADASWAVTSPEAAKEFSAACYYFGREVQPAAKVAIGLIEDAWGGAAIQAWLSNDALKALGGYDSAIAIAKSYAASPTEAERQYRTVAGAWFKSSDPALQASPAWNDPALDDNAWNSHEITGTWRNWEVAELKSFGGIVWLRKTVELTAAEAEGGASLALGPIDSTDMAWVNGSEIGAGFGYDVHRLYTVPAGVLHEGKNIIALAIQAGGGLSNPSDKLTLKLANGSAKTLTGPWRWKTSITSDKIGHAPYQPWLNQFGVSTLYNGMIVPLGATPIRGILWYQGETDVWQPKEYGRLLSALIGDWRRTFGAATPFYVVQLPSYGPATSKPVHSNWAALREMQRQVVEATPNAGLAVAIDLGSPDNIHPQAKQELGRRLGLLARKFVYGQDIVAQSPTPVAARRSGKSVILAFDHIGKGLETREWNRAIGFGLCEAPDRCGFVDGVVGRDSVTLDAAHHPKATSVRFCWSGSPLCNLVNSEGLPAVPFELPITGKNPIARRP